MGWEAEAGWDGRGWSRQRRGKWREEMSFVEGGRRGSRVTQGERRWRTEEVV